jgi:hypothetical protein
MKKKNKKKPIPKTSSGTSFINMLMLSFALLISGFAIYAVIDFYSQDRPEMEAYLCDNPNCGKVHYRPIDAEVETN